MFARKIETSFFLMTTMILSITQETKETKTNWRSERRKLKSAPNADNPTPGGDVSKSRETSKISLRGEDVVSYGSEVWQKPCQDKPKTSATIERPGRDFSSFGYVPVEDRPVGGNYESRGLTLFPTETLLNAATPTSRLNSQYLGREKRHADLTGKASILFLFFGQS